jgi:ABC-type phosphate transport system substrate-binding protein
MFSKKSTWWGLALAAAAFLGAVTPRSAEAQISVIVPASFSGEVNEDQVKRMFAGQMNSWPDGSRVQLVDQADSPVGQSFYSDVMGASPGQIRRALTAMVLSGQIPAPEQASSDAEVKAAVARLGGSIGYISSASLDASVREVLRIQ